MILALDLATRTGWAMVSVSGATRHGVRDFSAHAGRNPALYGAFDWWLSDMVTDFRPALIVYESPIFRGKATRLTFGLAAITELIAGRREANVAEVNLATIKKFATGQGNCGKDAMVAAVKSWGFAPQDDNAADAIALARYVWERRWDIPSLSSSLKSRKEVR